MIASLFWTELPSDRAVSLLVKWISLASMIGIIWLEFALFADISGLILGAPGITRAAMMAVAVFAVVYFTLRYGLRGFVFADLLHAPLLILSSTVLLAGCVSLYFWGHPVHELTWAHIAPTLPIDQLALFGGHVLVLNVFLILVSEAHWLRLWMFQDLELRLQKRAMGATALLWAVLACIGAFSYLLTGLTGDEAAVGMIKVLSDSWILFAAVFWIGGIGALFSTADAQIYAFLLVRSFRSRDGKLAPKTFSGQQPFLASVIAAVLLPAIYFFVRTAGWQIEKVIFAIVPLPLNLLPPLVMLAFGRRQRVVYPAASVVGYIALSVWGLLSPPQQFTATLSAALVPVAVSIAALLVSAREGSAAAPGEPK